MLLMWDWNSSSASKEGCEGGEKAKMRMWGMGPQSGRRELEGPPGKQKPTKKKNKKKYPAQKKGPRGQGGFKKSNRSTTQMVV